MSTDDCSISNMIASFHTMSQSLVK